VVAAAADMVAGATRTANQCPRALSNSSPPALNPMSDQPARIGLEADDFERVLSLEPFKGLKTIIESVSADQAARREAIKGAKSYEELLARLGYRITLTPQIHVQDCYHRLGASGGIKTVLPYYDIPTQSSLPTLINLNSTVTTTPKAAGFFNQMLTALKTQASAPQKAAAVVAKARG
jgi:hypothetical protein